MLVRAGADVAAQVEQQAREVEVTPEPVTRQGGWLDTIIIVEEPSSDAAVTRLEAGDIDVYAYNISEPDIAQRIFDSETLAYQTAYGNYNDITFMPSFSNCDMMPLVFSLAKAVMLAPIFGFVNL